MIPIKDTAGRTAFVFHYEAEGTPNEYADQVAHIEEHGDHKQPCFINYVRVIQNTDNSDKNCPNQHNFVRCVSGGDHVILQCLIVYLLSNRTKTVGKQLLRAESNLILYGDDLQNHIRYPNKPQQMEYGKRLKEVVALQNLKHLRRYKAQDHASNENSNSTD